VLAHTAELWPEFRNASIFITGGTGFFGYWLLSSFAAANERFKLKARAVVLTRDAEAFRKRTPELASDSAIRFHPGDVRSFEFPAGGFTHVIHGATPASATLNSSRPMEMLDINVEGTKRVLEFARTKRIPKFLLCSSGAVYGRQPTDVDRVPEDFSGGPDCLDPYWAYGEGKRVAELLCAMYAREHRIQTKIARGWTFVGPHLPLDIHFAIGNFLRDTLEGKPIRIQGDGTSFRSYLYTADLMIWLWTILAKGRTARAYNVGSEHVVSIAELARRTAAVVAPGTPVEIAREAIPGRPAERYVPSTERARLELGLEERIGLDEAIRRTAEWHRALEADPLRQTT